MNDISKPILSCRARDDAFKLSQAEVTLSSSNVREVNILRYLLLSALRQTITEAAEKESQKFKESSEGTPLPSREALLREAPLCCFMEQGSTTLAADLNKGEEDPDAAWLGVYKYSGDLDFIAINTEDPTPLASLCDQFYRENGGISTYAFGVGVEDATYGNTVKSHKTKKEAKLFTKTMMLEITPERFKQLLETLRTHIPNLTVYEEMASWVTDDGKFNPTIIDRLNAEYSKVEGKETRKKLHNTSEKLHVILGIDCKMDMPYPVLHPLGKGTYTHTKTGSHTKTGPHTKTDNLHTLFLHEEHPLNALMKKFFSIITGSVTPEDLPLAITDFGLRYDALKISYLRSNKIDHYTSFNTMFDCMAILLMPTYDAFHSKTADRLLNPPGIRYLKRLALQFQARAGEKYAVTPDRFYKDHSPTDIYNIGVHIFANRCEECNALFNIPLCREYWHHAKEHSAIDRNTVYTLLEPMWQSMQDAFILPPEHYDTPEKPLDTICTRLTQALQYAQATNKHKQSQPDTQSGVAL